MILRIFPLISTFILAAVLLSACQSNAPTSDPNAAGTQAVQTAFASLQQTKIVSTPAPTVTARPTATVPQTPPALPAVFTTTALNPLDLPHIYLNDSCQYLRDKWTSSN